MSREKRVICAVDRSRGRWFCLAVTCAMVAVLADVSNGSFTKRINKISMSLDEALYNLLRVEQNVSYTELSDNATYISSTAGYNARGMGGLYNLTLQFMDILISDELFPDDFIIVEQNSIDINHDNLSSVPKYYIGLLTIVTLLVLFGVLMPLSGFCFCCCRCCGNCGARSKPFDKKHDLCKKIMLGTALIVLGTLMLFSVVCAFVTNQRIEEGTQEVVSKVNVSVTDVHSYLENTVGQIDTLARTNYYEFQNSTFRILDETADIVYDKLAEYSNAVSMTTVKDMVDGMVIVKANLTSLKIYTNGLRSNASQLNDGLRKVKRDLLLTLQRCSGIEDCEDVANEYINKLGSDIDFNTLPDISGELDRLTTVLDDDIVGTVEEGYKNLQGIKTRINDVVRDQLVQVRSAISTAGEEIGKGTDSITSGIREFSSNFADGNDLARNMKQFDDYVKQYSPYRYYGTLAVSCVLLLITLCIVLGLMCGICGKRPDAYGDDCCNKGAGSRFLMCGIFFMFLSSFFLAVIVLAYFLTGVLSHKLVCESVRDPANSKIIELAEQFVGLPAHLPYLNITYIVTSCHRNESIYNVLRMDHVYNVSAISGYLDDFDINQQLHSLEEQIENNVDTNVNLLSPAAKNQLEDLANSGISTVNYDRFIDVMDRNFTSANLTELAEKLRILIKVINDRGDVPDAGEIVAQLQLSILHLETYQSKLVEPMIAGASDMIEIASALDVGLRFNFNSFEDAIRNLTDEVQSAENFLKENGADTLKKCAVDFAEAMKDHIQGYLERVVDNTIHNVGRCGPLSVMVNATLVATCDSILLPWNGFWFGVFWSLILFIPVIVVSVKLASLYQKYNPYGGHLIEAEYLYDAYADHDNIPLNSRSKSKKKQKKNRREERVVSQVPGPGGDHEVTRDYPGGSHAQDTRYADMAPKHWEEFPANGPPQYQRAPTEYERPPPYYFPGSGDQAPPQR